MAAAKQSREPMDTFMLYIPGTDRSQIELRDTLQPPPIPFSASHRHSSRQASPKKCVSRIRGSASGDSRPQERFNI